MSGFSAINYALSKKLDSANLTGVKIMYFEFVNDFNYSNLGINSNNTITEIVRAFGNYIINNYGNSQYAILEFSANTSDTVFSHSLPNNRQACIGTVKYAPQFHNKRVQVFLTDVVDGNNYIGTFKNSDTNDIEWQKVSTTTIEDVEETPIEDVEETPIEVE